MRYVVLKCIKKLSKHISVTDIGILFIMVAVINILLTCFSDGITGNDFWWHIKVGEWILENGQIPTCDIFSWYGIQKQLPWTAHEWLSDVIYFIIYDIFEDIGIFIFSLCAAMLMAFMMIHYVKEHLKDNLLIGGLFFIALAVVLSLFFYGRPHVFSFFLLFWELKVLYKYIEQPSTKQIFLLPIIGCLWSNLHGGSSNLSYILCFAFLFGCLCKFDFGRIYAERLEKKALLKLFGVGIGTVLSLMINPIGIQVITFPYTSVGDSLMMNTISEWQEPDVKNIGNLLFYFLPIILMTIGIVSKECKVRFIDILIMGMFLYLFFRSARFIMLWDIAACFYAFRYMPKCSIKEVTKKLEKIVLAICLVLFMIPAGYALKDTMELEKDEYISKVMSDEAIEFVKVNQTERMFNDYNLGEALIYNNLPVFFDARADMYLQENIYADGLSLTYLSSVGSNDDNTNIEVCNIIDKYQFDSFLILKGRPLYLYLISHENEFECVYEDEELAYFIACD